MRRAPSRRTPVNRRIAKSLAEGVEQHDLGPPGDTDVVEKLFEAQLVIRRIIPLRIEGQEWTENRSSRTMSRVLSSGVRRACTTIDTGLGT